MITTPEIICDVFTFLDKDQIERVQLVNQFWNNVIIIHKNILPLRQYIRLEFKYDQNYLMQQKVILLDIRFYAAKIVSYKIKFDGTNLSKIEEDVSSRYSQLTVDEVLTNLNDGFFDEIYIEYFDSEDRLDNLLNMIKLVTTKTGGRFRGRLGFCRECGSKKVEIFGKGFLNTARYSQTSI